MNALDNVRQRLVAGEFEFSRHAFRRAVERDISEQEIREAGASAELIENYPDDKYAPSALLLGFSAAGRSPALSSNVWRHHSHEDHHDL